MGCLFLFFRKAEGKEKKADSTALISKVKYFTGFYTQSITNLKYNIQRNGTIGGLNAAHVRSAYIYHRL